MLDMSWGEVMVIGAVALIVIGPKDLPRALRTVGQVTGKIRRMAAEFQGQFNEAMREAELDEVKRQIQGVNDSVSSINPGFSPIQTIRDELKGAVEGTGSVQGAAPSQADAVAGSEGLPLATEPPVAIAAPSLPEVADPGASVAHAVREAAPAESHPVADVPVAAAKPIEKAE